MLPDSPPGVQLLTQAVKAEARRLGFDLVGVTTPAPPAHFLAFERWLAESRHGEMIYLAEPASLLRRMDPRLILPECRSILMLGISYPASLPEVGESQGLNGKIASYAWGTDYHEVLPVRLKALVSFIECQLGQSVPNRWYTDTGPVLERDLAQRAGLGWIGKNTCLINPALGSYFFLAEILLGIELAVDQPFQADRCGTCTRCLDACPTSCILPDRTLDARRCLSYLTIELKSAIPPELRPSLNGWVFGCDICQQVCPWNVRLPARQVEPLFMPSSALSSFDLMQALALSAQAFNRLFKASPVRRSKRRGFLRNATVVLGNLGDPQALPLLAQVLQEDPEPLVRSHAAWALGQIGTPAALQALHRAEMVEKDPTVREEIQRAVL